MMKLDFAFLADAASVENGKLFVLGGSIDRIWAKQVPAVHPYMTLVARFELSQSELDRAHRLEVVLLDADGSKVLNIAGEMNIVRASNNPEVWKPQGHIVTLNLAGVKFGRFGDYVFEVLFDGVSVKSIPLSLILSSEKQPNSVNS